jgi:hypothetical protein
VSSDATLIAVLGGSMREMALVLVALLLSGCEATVTGATDDGEIFTGTTTATGYYDVPGTLHLTSNRGRDCVGQYASPPVGPVNGTAALSCSNGDKGSVILTGAGLNGGRGVGSIGSHRFTFTWE